MRRIVGLLFLVAVLIVTLSLTAFGTDHREASVSAPAPATRLLPPGPPRPQVVASYESLTLQLPVPQQRVSALGYHAAGDGALPLRPIGSKANEGLVARLVHKVFGGGDGRLRYYQLPGAHGPGTGSLDVGAPAGTGVYAPVDGTIVAVSDYVLDGRPYGSRIDIQPATAPSLVVSMTRLRAEPGLAVGTSVSASSTKLGRLLDLSRVEEQALARFTHDPGNHVSIEVHQAATLALP